MTKGKPLNQRDRQPDLTPLLLIWGTAVFYAFLCLYLRCDPCGASGYSTYTLQALAWREGRLSLGQDYPWLELAIYQGDYYVSFPPVPSVPLFFLSFIFHENTPDHLMVKLYVLIGCLSVYAMLRRAKYGKGASAAFALLCSFASCMLAMTLNGGVWYQAQTLGFSLTAAAAALMLAERPTPALLCYALSVGCRPFNALFGIVLFVWYFDKSRKARETPRRAIRRLLPGVGLGLMVAAAYGAYNYARFGNIFEFGHNYLPEFSFQGGVQFSLAHVLNNVRTFVLGLPFERIGGAITLKQFGFSFLLACPVFSLMLFWIGCDLCKRRFTPVKAAICLCFLAQLFLLLLHRTFGGYQFGARYTCDLLPYAAVYLALPGHQRRVGFIELATLCLAAAFSVYGAATILL